MPYPIRYPPLSPATIIQFKPACKTISTSPNPPLRDRTCPIRRWSPRHPSKRRSANSTMRSLPAGSSRARENASNFLRARPCLWKAKSRGNRDCSASGWLTACIGSAAARSHSAQMANRWTRSGQVKFSVRWRSFAIRLRAARAARPQPQNPIVRHFRWTPPNCRRRCNRPRNLR